MTHRTTHFIVALSFCVLSTGALAFIPLNRIVAIVNDSVILESQLANREALIVNQLTEKKTSLPDAESLRKQVLERLILEDLQLQMARRTGITIDDTALNTGMQRLAAQNGISVAEFRDSLVDAGYNYSAFREQLRNEITMNQLRQQLVEQQIQVSVQEIDNELATVLKNPSNKHYRLGHILISVPEGASPDVIQKKSKQINAIRAQLSVGANFAKTAVSESEGRQALKGGDLGWRKVDALPSLFLEVVSGMEKGDISDVLRSPSGFHIVTITDMKGETKHLIEQTLASHILLKSSAIASDNALKEKLKQIRERALQGEDFATLARGFSQDSGSAGEGGSLDWVTPGTMVPEFEAAMDELKPGEISPPIESRFGWHLIKVHQRRSHDNTDEYQRMQAKENIRRRKIEEEMDIWLRRLRDESYVEFLLDDS
ncbi:MAG: peptidylprolyl isomerase [Gammaproteobacteria bacterium]